MNPVARTPRTRTGQPADMSHAFQLDAARRLVHRADFPLPARVAGPRSRLWLATEVDAWATPAARRSPAPSLGSTHAATG